MSAAFFAAIRRTPGLRLVQTPPALSLMAMTNPAPRSVIGWSTTPTRGPPVPSARHQPSTGQRARPSGAEALACATRTALYDREYALSVPSVDLTNQVIGHTPPDLFGSGFGEKELPPD